MNIPELEGQLQAAQGRLKQVLKSGRGDLREYKTALDDVAAAQRALAAAFVLIACWTEGVASAASEGGWQ